MLESGEDKGQNTLVRKIPQHFIVTGSAWISRVITALVQILGIRILLEGLGSERYAAFLLLNAFVAWYSLADMGVGTSLQNYVSEERAKGRDEANYLVLGALVAGTLLFLAMGLLYLLSPYLSEVLLKRFDFMSGTEKSRIFVISGMLFLGLSIGSIAYKVWYAQHKGHLANIVSASAAVSGLGLVWMVVHQQWDAQSKLLWSIIAFTLPATLLSVISLIRQTATALNASWRLPTTVALLNLVKRSLKFWLLYALATIVLNVDYVILSQFLSANEIVIYGITSRLFGFAAFFYTSYYAALWPHFTEAITNNDWQKVETHIKRGLLFSAGIVISLTLFLLLFMPSIADVLSPREKLNVPLLFILLFGGYHLILVWVHGFAVVLQSMSDMRVLLIWSGIQALLSIFFQILFVHFLGIYGITLGLVASFLFTAVWVAPNRVRQHIRLSGFKSS